MPLKTFWLMNENVKRLQAESDLREMAISAVSQNPEGFSQHQERLVLELGEVVIVERPEVMNAVRDQAGFEELRLMAAAMN